MKVPNKIQTWQMTQPWSKDKKTGKVAEGKLEKTEIPVPDLQPGEVLIEIAGCGVCHTDISYFYLGVPTVSKPPLTLGHEISGVVVAGDEQWVGREVIVPAVMPCHSCPICYAGRENRCLTQKMPGSNLEIYGGFASHIPVPSRDLCIVKDRGDFELAELAVVADAITSPYQACLRAELKDGDNVIVVGVTGGLGSYVAQLAKALGAKTVVGVGRNPERLKRALQYGADFAINSTGKDGRTVRNEFREICKSNGLPHNYLWKVFEVTGSGPGQEIALALVSFVSKLIILGYSATINQYMISKLMAFDAEIIGTWGCPPKHYPKVLKWVLNNTIKIKPFVEARPMSKIKETFKEAQAGKLMKRIVLTPDF